LRAQFHGHHPRRGSGTGIAALLSSSLRRPQLSECFYVGWKMRWEHTIGELCSFGLPLKVRGLWRWNRLQLAEMYKIGGQQPIIGNNVRCQQQLRIHHTW
jgi:hypothetical protein